MAKFLAETSERTVLGVAMAWPDTVPEIQEEIRGPQDFADSRHRALWAEIVAEYARTGLSDASLFVQRVEPQSEAVGGSAYVSGLLETAISSATIRPHARRVANAARLRRMHDAVALCEESIAAADPDDVDDVADECERLLHDASDRPQVSSEVHIGDLVSRRYDALDAGEADAEHLLTGYGELDAMIGGLRSSNLVLLAARPGVGKTAMALNIADRVVSGLAAAPVCFYSMEMSRDEIADRLMSMRSRIDSSRIRARTLTDKDMTNLMGVCGLLGESPLWIDDTAGLSVTQFRAKARRVVRRHKCRVLILDYLQLMREPSRARHNRESEVASVSRALKATAQELGVAILACAQLNRGVEHRADSRPRLSDLRESGSLEQDANTVLMLHRQMGRDVDDTEAELIVAKQRQGPTGSVRLRWDPATTRYLGRDER